MPAIPPRPVQLACPNCNSPVRANLFTVIDVGQQPELKAALLAGQLNVAVCTNCGTASMLGSPVIYHDPTKQLCLVYFPQELNAQPDEQERFIGEATSFLIRNLPPNAPRGYLLTPRRFMSLASLMDAILEADGIPREALEKQRQRIDLTGRLAEALDNEEQLKRLVEQNKDALDYEFFATLSAFIDASAQEQRDDSVELLTRLRDTLVELTGFSPEGEEADADLTEVIKQLEDANDEELEALIAEVRPVIDYGFFQEWTARIEELEKGGEKEAADRLVARRSIILETVERMDKEAQAMFEAGAGLLREVLEAPDMRAALEERVSQIDEAFLLVLSANINAAERAGQHDMVDRLQEVGDLANEIVQARMTPEERFINELLMTETAQESTRLLRQRAAQVTPAMVKQLNDMADQYEKRGMKPASEQLRQLAREASAMLF